MQYITFLDYHHLDHSFFMKTFAEAMAMQNGCSGIILHSDSPYTDRLMQTGIMREDAVIRSTRDLNHRIVALLADNGISGIGINGFQREIIRKSGDELIVQKQWIENRPAGTHLILSNLVWNTDSQSIEPVPLHIVAEALRRSLAREYLIVFPKDEGVSPIVQKTPESEDKISKNRTYSVDDVPIDLTPLPEKCYFCTFSAFKMLPDTAGLQKITG